MISALLCFGFLFLLLYGVLPTPVLLLLCAGLAVFLYINDRHKHTEFISIDVIAQFSRLKTVNASLKIATLLLLMVASITSSSAWCGVFLAVAMLALAVFVGGMKLAEYVETLALPVSFLLVGGLVLLIEFQAQPTGVLALSLPFTDYWLCVSTGAQASAALLIGRAMGALSCLLLIGMSTPMPELIGALRRLRCPALIIDLMYLIYRYIFVLLNTHNEMQHAAQSRLGMKDYKTSLRTTAAVYSNLLALSYRKASINFDAMESRCFDAGVRFLEQHRPVRATQVGVCLLLVTAAVVLNVASRIYL